MSPHIMRLYYSRCEVLQGKLGRTKGYGNLHATLIASLLDSM